MDAIILAGGLSSRLKSVLKLPKPFLPINEKCNLIQYQGEWLESIGIKYSDIIVSTTIDFLELYKKRFPYGCTFSTESRRLGTGGALKLALEMASTPVYVMNVDDLLFFKAVDHKKNYISNLTENIKSSKGVLVLGNPTLPFSLVEISDGKLTRYDRQPILKDKWISIGHYLFTKGIDDLLPVQGDLEDSLRDHIEDFNYFKFNGTWITVNDYKQYQDLLSFIKEGKT